MQHEMHTSHSAVVSGIVGSSILVRTSTKGTPATAALNKSGLIFRTTPINMPSALLPLVQNISFMLSTGNEVSESVESSSTASHLHTIADPFHHLHRYYLI
jgi:hypothetical protein